MIAPSNLAVSLDKKRQLDRLLTLPEISKLLDDLLSSSRSTCGWNLLTTEDAVRAVAGFLIGALPGLLLCLQLSFCSKRCGRIGCSTPVPA